MEKATRGGDQAQVGMGAGRQSEARGRVGQAAARTAPYVGDADAEGDMITAEIEQRIEDIESGRRKLTVYPDVEEYLRHVDKVLSE